MKKYKKLLSTYNEVVKAKKEEKKESDWKKTDFTFEETTLLKEKMSLMYDITRWVKHYNLIDGFTPDWGDSAQRKFGITIEYEEMDTTWYSIYNPFVFGLSVSTRERAEQMIKEFRERVQKYY